MTAISVVMPCFNQGYQLRRILQAYDAQQTGESFELIAVDDASSDETFQILTNYQPARFLLHAYRQDKNQGPASARNLALKSAQSPLVVFVGDDILPEASFIQQHLNAHRLHPEPETAILGRVAWPQDMPVNTLMKHIDGVGAEQFSYFYLKEDDYYDFRHFYTANISIKQDILQRVNRWFDTDFPFAAFEDAEFSFRLAQKGMKILYNRSPVGFHYHYHHIWSFSDRQLRAGMMAIVLIRKHPNLGPLILGEKWLARMARTAFNGLTHRPDAQKNQALEKTLLHLTSSFEWSPNPLSDWLYGKMLNYFYQKGSTLSFFSMPGLQKAALDQLMHQCLEAIANEYAALCLNSGITPPNFAHLT